MSKPTPIIIDEESLRPAWDVWLTVGGVPLRTRPCWEINGGNAGAGIRGWLRIPKLVIAFTRFVLVGANPVRAQRKELEQAFYPDDRQRIRRLTNGEAVLLTMQYGAAETAWALEYQSSLQDAYLARMRSDTPAPNVREINSSEDLVDHFSGMPGVRVASAGADD